MRFNPRADISGGQVEDAGSSSSSRGLPLPTTAGGGKLGLILMVLGLVVRFLLSRRKKGALTR